MATFSTHILDTSKGKPVPQLTTSLYRQNDAMTWQHRNHMITDQDGRSRLTGELSQGIYKIKFEVEEYFKMHGVECFYPVIEIVFKIKDAGHYHIPLLLSPFGYSTYRGS